MSFNPLCNLGLGLSFSLLIQPHRQDPMGLLVGALTSYLAGTLHNRLVSLFYGKLPPQEQKVYSYALGLFPCPENLSYPCLRRCLLRTISLGISSMSVAILTSLIFVKKVYLPHLATHLVTSGLLASLPPGLPLPTYIIPMLPTPVPELIEV